MTEARFATPWPLLRDVLDIPLHPGGRMATVALLDRAGVGQGTTMVDIGCGGGETLELARNRGARAVGVDRAPAGSRAVRGDMNALPVMSDVADVVLAECTLCLADDIHTALLSASRILRDGGRLAISEMTVGDGLPDLPPRLGRALCLQGRRDRSWLVERIESAGFTVRTKQSHRDDLLQMRDRLADRIDYHGLLRAMGEDGRALAAGIDRLESAVEDGTVGYVSVVAETD